MNTIDHSAKPGKDTAVNIPAVLETPMWVTTANMEKTVVADGFDTASAICNGIGKACKEFGIH